MMKHTHKHKKMSVVQYTTLLMYSTYAEYNYWLLKAVFLWNNKKLLTYGSSKSDSGGIRTRAGEDYGLNVAP